MAKLFCSELAMKATLGAIQVLGGVGYTNEYPVERMARDAKVCEIGEGTNEIQRLVIGRHLVAETFGETLGARSRDESVDSSPGRETASLGAME
jgi:alkylation response protein AidB-like acyl-CoA dehydrogenase